MSFFSKRQPFIETSTQVVIRITLGSIFISSGWGKLHHLSKVIGYFDSLGIPFASFQAPVVSGLELIGGAFILLGVFTQLSAFLLAGIMMVALLTAKAQEITSLGSIFEQVEFLYLLLLLTLLSLKPSKLSLGWLMVAPKEFIKNKGYFFDFANSFKRRF